MSTGARHVQSHSVLTNLLSQSTSETLRFKCPKFNEHFGRCLCVILRYTCIFHPNSLYNTCWVINPNKWWVIFLRFALSISRLLYWKCLCSYSLSDCLQSSPYFFCNFTLLPFQSISSCHILKIRWKNLILLLPFSANPHLFFLQVLFNPPTLRSSTFCFPLKFPLDQKMSLPSCSFPPLEMCVREAALSWAFQVTRSLQRSQPLAFLSFSPPPRLCYPSPRLQDFFFFYF